VEQVSVSENTDSLDQLLPALIAARAEFPAVKKDGYNPHFKSKFASLKAVREATEPILGKHGLTITQFPSQTYEGKPALTTWLAHSSGQFIKDTTPLSMVKSDPQAQGSAITYLRRYGWSAVLGLVTDEDDDDGNMATVVAPQAKSLPQNSAEMGRLIAAAKRNGKGKDDIDSMCKKKYGVDLTKASNEQVTELADFLTETAVAKEMKA